MMPPRSARCRAAPPAPLASVMSRPMQEVLPLPLRPGAVPVSGTIARSCETNRFEIARRPPARIAHLGAHRADSSRMDEAEDCGRQLFRRIAEDAPRARADLDEIVLLVEHDDQVERRLADPPAVLDLARQAGGLRAHLVGHARERPGEHADLAAGIDGAGTVMPRGEPLDRMRHLNQRPRQRTREENTSGSAASATTSAPNMLGHGVVLANSRAERDGFQDGDARTARQLTASTPRRTDAGAARMTRGAHSRCRAAWRIPGSRPGSGTASALKAEFRRIG